MKALLIFIPFFYSVSLHAEAESTLTIDLKYVTSDEVITVIKQQNQKPVAITGKNSKVFLTGPATHVNQLKQIVDEIDQPPVNLSLSFISTTQALSKNNNHYHIGKNIEKTAQTISVQEGQWANVTTGFSIPVVSRTRNADGSESQSLKYKKILQKYHFRVMEYNGNVSVQVDVNRDKMNSTSGEIKHQAITTRLYGKLSQWIKVSAEEKIAGDNSVSYSTHSRTKNPVQLYIKIDK